MESKNCIDSQVLSDTLTVLVCYSPGAFKFIKYVDSAVHAYKILVVYMLHSSYLYLIAYLLKHKIYVSYS